MSSTIALLVSIILTVVVGLIIAKIDSYWIHRRAKRISERNRIVELLRK